MPTANLVQYGSSKASLRAACTGVWSCPGSRRAEKSVVVQTGSPVLPAKGLIPHRRSASMLHAQPSCSMVSMCSAVNDSPTRNIIALGVGQPEPTCSTLINDFGFHEAIPQVLQSPTSAARASSSHASVK